MDEIWSELHHEFKSDAEGNLKKVVNVQAVLSSVDNILGTRKGERVMLPTFGSSLWNGVFDPLDAHLSDFLSNDIREAITLWDDRPLIHSVDFKGDSDKNTAYINVAISIRGYDNIFEFQKLTGTSGGSI